MYVIGMTGRSGSGKTLVAEVFREAGVPVFDADRVYHTLVDAPSPCTRALAAELGEEVLTPDGALNRPYVASLVFGTDEGARERRARLNLISHRFVSEAFCDWCKKMEEAGHSSVLLDAPTLFEAGMNVACDTVIGVIAPPECAVERIVSRDGITREAARNRLASQVSEEELRGGCEFILYNGGTREDAVRQANQIMNELKKRGMIQ